MLITETRSEGLRRAYSIVVPASDIEARQSARLAELGRTLRLPGFRPGKVPLSLVRQRYGAAVTAEVLEEQINTATRQLLSERGLRPATQPKVDLAPPPAEGAVSGQPADLAFTVEMELLPDIVLPELKDIQLTRLKATVAPEAVDAMLARFAQSQRTLTDVAEPRPAAAGDVLVVDYAGSVDGVPFDGGKAEGKAIDVAGEGFIPGFTEQLVGMSAGETKVIDVTFPDPYNAPELAGKQAQFTITAHRLQQAELPAIDDEFAKKMGFDSLADVRELMTTQSQRELDNTARLHIKRELLDILAERATFPAPETLVAAEFDQIWQRLESERKAGRIEDEDKNKDDDTLRAEFRAIADRRVRLGLLLAEIGRANRVTVSQDEMARAIRNEARRYQGQEQQVLEYFSKNPEAAEPLRGPIFEEKVVDYVLDLAKVTDKPVSIEALNKAAESEATALPAAAASAEAVQAEPVAVASPAVAAAAAEPVAAEAEIDHTTVTAGAA